jgi:predicted type IV restriction endonuclease
VPKAPKIPAPFPIPISEVGVQYTILGESKKANNAIGALVDILRTLANRNPHFIERLAQVVGGRTRNHVARSRNDVYPHKPELIGSTMQLVPGWWLGTNIANREKVRIIEKACEVEGLVFGRDISIKLPNAG